MAKLRTRTSIYLNPPLAAALSSCKSGTISNRLGQVCDRYAEINRRARIAQQFSEAELNSILDCCNGTQFEPSENIDGAVLANFEDGLVDGLAEKWGISAPAMISKLRTLTYSDQVALVENIETFWRNKK